MIGDGPELPSGDDLVDVRGRLPRSEALAWIANASALVSTSRVEGAPTVVREARALGVPVVAFPAGDLAKLAQLDRGIHLVHDQSALERWLVEHVAER
jgi:glycosyltransferase involved in cell wall biosynthesis